MFPNNLIFFCIPQFPEDLKLRVVIAGSWIDGQSIPDTFSEIKDVSFDDYLPGDDIIVVSGLTYVHFKVIS